MTFIRPSFWQASSHTTISQEIYREAAYKFVDRWLAAASEVQTLDQAKRDLSCLCIAALNIGDKTLARQARRWHKRLLLTRSLCEPFATGIRSFFSIANENELVEAISASDRAMSVFEQNDIERIAEQIAADDDNIHRLLADLPK